MYFFSSARELSDASAFGFWCKLCRKRLRKGHPCTVIFHTVDNRTAYFQAEDGQMIQERMDLFLPNSPKGSARWTAEAWFFGSYLYWFFPDLRH
jgi:hypothetical protein